jgi:hypothetical protein
MWPYWLMFFLSAWQALTRLKPISPPLSERSWSDLWCITFALLVLMIGLRHEVGGDWLPYKMHVEAIENETFFEALVQSEPAFSLLNWIAAQSGLGVYFVNSIFALLFTWGLLSFCRSQPRPWLALVVAVPYLITVVAMGYSRQGVAIGLVMLGLTALQNKSLLKFLFWVVFAATFHKSAIILVPLAMFADNQRKLWTFLWVLISAILLFELMLQEALDSLVNGYIVAEYESSGAAVRVAMNSLPAVLFLIFRKRFALTQAQRKFWVWMAYGGLAFVVLLYISPSSTAVDRVALYWIPLQLFVWSRLPDALGRSGGANEFWVYSVVVYSATVHFVWLFYADHAFAWLPYQFYPWVWLWH